jgi:hypothetical protein
MYYNNHAQHTVGPRRPTTTTIVDCSRKRLMEHVFNTILYENEFKNPQIFQQTISLFPLHSTLY